MEQDETLNEIDVRLDVMIKSVVMAEDRKKEYYPAIANLYFYFFKCLKEAGFTDAQALEVVKNHNIM